MGTTILPPTYDSFLDKLLSKCLLVKHYSRTKMYETANNKMLVMAVTHLTSSHTQSIENNRLSLLLWATLMIRCSYADSKCSWATFCPVTSLHSTNIKFMFLNGTLHAVPILVVHTKTVFFLTHMIITIILPFAQ